MAVVSVDDIGVHAADHVHSLSLAFERPTHPPHRDQDRGARRLRLAVRCCAGRDVALFWSLLVAFFGLFEIPTHHKCETVCNQSHK